MCAQSRITRTKHKPTRSPRRRVTQEMLQEFMAVKERAEMASNRFKRLEEKLIKMIRAETPVETGPLTARVQGFITYDVNMEDLRGYLSQWDYAMLTTSLPLQSREELMVEEEIEIEIEE